MIWTGLNPQHCMDPFLNSQIDALLNEVRLPRVVPVNVSFDRPVISDVAGAFLTQLHAAEVLEKIRPGMRVAIGTGSRGISNLTLILRLLVDQLKLAGAHPFLFPAMGSHGGATAAGQLGVLNRMGISEESVRAPVRATMDVIQIGTTPDGVPAYMDAIAAESDAIVVVNRIKPHTSFRASVESGLIKMSVIGVGKQKGAEACHRLGYPRMEHNLLSLFRSILSSNKLMFGVALLENAYHETCQIEVIPASQMEAREPKLLEAARAHMPKLPIRDLDVLIVDEIGKNISGLGMDPNITGRYPTPTPLLNTDPSITRLVVLDITKTSEGNATGLGLADVTTRRVFEKFNYAETYCNVLTSTSASAAKLPMVMRSDVQAVQAAIKICLAPDPNQVRLIRIKNTLSMDQILVSENLISELQINSQTQVAGVPKELALNDD